MDKGIKITIETTDPELLAGGAEPTCVIECDGYFVVAHEGGDDRVVAQGRVNTRAVATAIRGLPGDIPHKIVGHLLTSALADCMAGEDKDDE